MNPGKLFVTLVQYPKHEVLLFDLVAGESHEMISVNVAQHTSVGMQNFPKHSTAVSTNDGAVVDVEVAWT